MEKTMNDTNTMTPRTRVRRVPDRASYDREAIYNTIDQAFIGTIAFYDGENAHAIPTAIWREGPHLYIHGSNGSRLLKHLQTGAEVCVSITNMHGLVLARSAFHHSMNYSSVCIYGSFAVTLEKNKNQHLQRFMEHWAPGRWQHVRQPNKNELAATTIMHISLEEAVAKARQGGPKDDPEDMAQQVWAGVIPLELTWQTPQQTSEQTNLNLPGQILKK